MPRKLAIWGAWQHFADYHSRKLAEALEPEYETTVTYRVLDWDEFDVVMPFYPHRHPECERAKVVKRFAAVHEVNGCALGAVNVACATSLLERLRKRDEYARWTPFGVDPADFYPAPFPEGDRLVVGWAGNPGNPYKRFEKVKETIEALPDVEFKTACYRMKPGGVYAPDYETASMREFYASIHVLVCGSRSEGFCFPLLEASACGRPVITFDVGVARDLLNTGTGVVLVDDFEEMGRAVRAINWRAFGEISAAAVEGAWTWDAVRWRWLEALDGRSRQWEAGERDCCLLCDFEAETEEEIRQHQREKHPGMIERGAELRVLFQRGELTACEMRETLEEEFAQND